MSHSMRSMVADCITAQDEAIARVVSLKMEYQRAINVAILDVEVRLGQALFEKKVLSIELAEA